MTSFSFLEMVVPEGFDVTKLIEELQNAPGKIFLINKKSRKN